MKSSNRTKRATPRLPRASHAITLSEYHRKRRLAVTPEPRGGKHQARKPDHTLAYVIQKHQASHLHYDFRLEWGGSLISWAIPKGPSLDPSVKRFATRVENHPLEYASFEGVIPEGEYGGGTVMVWDKGSWSPDNGNVDVSLEKGELKFTLHGGKLKGSWVLVRTRGFDKNPSRSAWLLIKHRDRYASTQDVTKTKPYSAVSRRLLADIAREKGGDVAKAAAGDSIIANRTMRRR